LLEQLLSDLSESEEFLVVSLDLLLQLLGSGDPDVFAQGFELLIALTHFIFEFADLLLE
jgi:hypothetical protein